MHEVSTWCTYHPSVTNMQVKYLWIHDHYRSHALSLGGLYHLKEYCVVQGGLSGFQHHMVGDYA